MQYRTLVTGAEPVSVLGFGCMRFPKKGNAIDIAKTEDLLMHAVNRGINYFDTAYPYHGGKSEVILGNFLAEHDLRKSVYIADKLPVIMLNRSAQIESIFDKQLKRLSTDYIDYYLMHSLMSVEQWQMLKDFGIVDFIAAKKAAGSIRHIGFSFHGRAEEFLAILDDYPWDFCQIQYNYLDEHYQAGLAGMRRAADKGIGVVVMEPLRGGDLANAPDKVMTRFKDCDPARTAVDWALSWLWNQPEVAVLLSGMNERQHIDENCQLAERTVAGSMSTAELSVIEDVKNIYRELMQVPCTGCGYCMPCPFGVDIPATFSHYNNKYYFDVRLSQVQYLVSVTGALGNAKAGADRCTACGRCEKKCPQNIAIIDELKNAHRELDFWPMRMAFSAFGAFNRLIRPRGKR